MAKRRRMAIDPDLWRAAEAYVDAQIRVIEKYGSRVKLSAKKRKELTYDCAKPAQRARNRALRTREAATGFLADGLREYQGQSLLPVDFNNLVKQICARNLARMVPEFNWMDLRDQIIDARWVKLNKKYIRIQVP